MVAQLGASHRIGFVTNGLADVHRPRLASCPLAGVAGGRAHGLTTVWVAPRTAPDPEDPGLRPDHRIGTLDELPGLLGS
ncbi:MAG: hypothetical protein R6V28_10120 [Nitriliruptoraceae bacterium]